MLGLGRKRAAPCSGNTALKCALFIPFLVVPFLVLPTTTYALETLLKIVDTDGAIQLVTDEDFARIGEITVRTPLIGYPKDAKVESIGHDATGLRLRDVLTHFNISGTVAEAIAFDAYRIDIPVADALNYDVILARKVDGKQLSIRDRGPLWVVYPLKDHPELKTPVFEARAVWQLKELHMR